MLVRVKSVVYIGELIKCLIIFRHFRELKSVLFSDKPQEKVEEGVLVDFGRNSTRLGAENRAGTED